MKKLISAILAVLMLTSVLAALPAYATENPFTDVPEGKWYTEAALWAAENGYMTGTSATTFEPSAFATRAMLVQILWAISGKPQPTADLCYEDVKAGDWFADAVIWAAGEGIAVGTGSGFFMPEAPITREQFALILRNFVKEYLPEKYNAHYNASVLDQYADKGDISAWARNGIAWAVYEGIIAGISATTLAPGNYSTRAQIAFMLKQVFKLTKPEYMLNGVDLSEYTIIIPAGGSGSLRYDDLQFYVDKMAGYLAEATGVSVPVVSDADVAPVPGAHEILVGHTNREDAGLVTVDRSEYTYNTVHYKMTGTYLIINSNEQNTTTPTAVTRCFQDLFGVWYYGNDVVDYKTTRGFNIASGVELTDSPDVEYNINYQHNGGDRLIGPSETGLNFCNLMHTIPEFAADDFDGSWGCHLKYYMNPDPCLSDSHNIDNIIKNVRWMLQQERNKGKERVNIWVTQSDADVYCKCAKCAKIYRLWGRCATYTFLFQYLGDALKDEFPEAQIVNFAYKYTTKVHKTEISQDDYDSFVASWTEKYVPPRKVELASNCVQCICTDNACTTHAYDDPNCKNDQQYNNVLFNQNFNAWCEIYPKIYIWDYWTAYSECPAPYPMIYQIWRNYDYFARHNVVGTYILGGGQHSNFSDLLTYLEYRLTWNMGMSWDEYSDTVNDFLRVYYGPGWEYLRQYIDELEEYDRNNERDWVKNHWDNALTPDEWRLYIDHFKDLFLDAEAACENETQLYRVKNTELQVDYVIVSLAYLDYKNGDISLEEYQQISSDFYANICDVSDHVEGIHAPLNWSDDPSLPGFNPEKWVYE